MTAFSGNFANDIHLAGRPFACVRTLFYGAVVNSIAIPLLVRWHDGLCAPPGISMDGLLEYSRYRSNDAAGPDSQGLGLGMGTAISF